MKKKLILVTSPPACGKTYVAMKLAAELNHVVYLDKDALIILSRQIFEVAGQPYDRSSDFFEEHIRDYEYAAILDMAVDALEYDDIALINALHQGGQKPKIYGEPPPGSDEKERKTLCGLGRDRSRDLQEENDPQKQRSGYVEAGALG